MITQFLPILCVALAVVGAALYIAWRVVGAIVKPMFLRRLLQLGFSAAIVGGILLLGPRILPVSPAGAPSQFVLQDGIAPDATPAASTTIREETLTITLSATGRLETGQTLDLEFEDSAPVVELLVEPGQAVSAGDVLARLDATDAEAALRDAQIALTEAQYAYHDLVSPARDVDIAVAEAGVTLAEASLYAASQSTDPNDVEIARLETELARNQLWQSQLSRDQQLASAPEFRTGNGGAQAGEIRTNAGVESAETQVQISELQYADAASEGPDASSLASANAQLVQAQAHLDALLAGPDDNELRRAEIDLETARLEVQKAEQRLEDTVLRAPVDGVIAAENLTVGEVPPPGTAITLIDDSSYTIDLLIDETDISSVAAGQPVEVTVDALPTTPLTGTISKIEDAPVVDGQLVTYSATVLLDPTDAPLRPGMNATANIVIDEVEDALVVPNSYIRVNSITQATTIVVRGENGELESVPVQIGARNQSVSQVLGEVQAGQEVFLLPEITLTEAGGGIFPAPPGAVVSGGGGGQSQTFRFQR